MSAQLQSSEMAQGLPDAAAPLPPPIPAYMRVHIIGHEDAEDPHTHSKVVLYRTVIRYNGQSFERALRFSRFYAFYANLTGQEKKDIGAKFPHRYPFVAELNEEKLKKRERQLNAFFEALCNTVISPTMELTLLNLFKIKERHLASHIRGSILFVPHPRADGTSADMSAPQPVRRIFTSSMSSMSSVASSSRASIQSSFASDLSYANSARSSSLSQDLSSACGSPRPSSVRSWATYTSTMSEILEEASKMTDSVVGAASPVTSSSPMNYQEKIHMHMNTISKMLMDEDLHLLTPKQPELPTTS
ncbi:Aste57867_13832 [Aphanomyces stellatus]|uniref:Aste57867_13832 protein n=1 Tax=Aphanomyces stellatus TaxID=120398 RepID=A0A485KZQ3_9STRA|nr:hypothetical protein As57867_013782 [Aphanomyces stellatus]VFT90664.1 Aste57867_13832 [Aphanomyces stellatus]